MENNDKERKNKLLITIIILFGLIILAETGYICYNKGVEKKKSEVLENENDKEEQNDTTEKNNYVAKTYTEIINSVNLEDFDKNKFDGKFLIKKVNILPSTGTDFYYYDLNGKQVPKYEYITELVGWKDIKNYNSSLYEGLEVNTKIEYSQHSLYRYSGTYGENVFYLNACKSKTNTTIKDAFDNGNISLFWNGDIKAKEVINVSKNNVNTNELGIFMDELGVPYKIYRYPDGHMSDSSVNEVQYDYSKRYELIWAYDDYYISLDANVLMKDGNEINSSIGSVRVYSKKADCEGRTFEEIIKVNDQNIANYKD